ncbi:uncharacterized protein LOC141612958 [Silene latifolia]|uniref:uncharacterized protein LOC141612958 n=1 Tax=Silene latifolia TaxID=37657 RepID=UPI003D7815F2
MSSLMEEDVYNAAFNGDVTVFSNKNQEQLLKKTYQKDNIIHIAAQHKQLNFIKAALNWFPSTICESLLRDQNCQGNTPFHIVAHIDEEIFIHRLYEFFSAAQCGDADGSDWVFPWRRVNLDGNTAAHVALLYGNVSAAMYLVDKDGFLARVTNHSKETLLHLAIQYHDSDDPETQATSSQRDNFLPIIEQLLKTERSLACWANMDGSTPLHLAASLDPAYCIQVIKAMLARCPEAAAVQDERSGHTILHLLTNNQLAKYNQGVELFQIPQLSALINIKDRQGDTPLHLASRNQDRIMVRVLLESSPKLGLKNKSGVSLRSLHRQLGEMRTTDTPVEYRRKLTEEECEAALQGNVAFLNEKLDSLGMNFLVSQTPREGNILHVLMQCKFNEDLIDKAIEFTKLAIHILPSLIGQQDRNGNTLLHIILEKTVSYRLRCRMDNLLMIVQTEALHHAKDGPHLSAYRLKNLKGDTPLHVAIRFEYYDFAIRLLKVDSEVAGYVNNCKQTPLHLLSPDYDCSSETVDELISCLINGNADLPYVQDEDGLTPLLTAVQKRNLHTIKKLHKRFPASTEIADFKGRTLWHLFGYRHVQRFGSLVAKSYESSFLRGVWDFLICGDGGDRMRRLMRSMDNDGNTRLHLAIANQQFSFAHFIICRSRRGIEELLAIENKDGVSSFNLIGSADHLPLEFEKILTGGRNLLFGYRSMYSIPTTKIDAFTNTIGVIAALLATITFTAAFTVPGGLDNSNGTPLLVRNAMFQVFMVADVVAMCLSVMVLFCLLWILTTSNKKESILLLDVSVFLLQTSFYATLVTFMTGLYVTTISIVPAIAISTCVICTLLIILMHKRFVMLTVVPFFGGLIIWGPRLVMYTNVLLSFLWSLIRKHKCFGST